MFYIMKFHRRLHDATRETVLAVHAGDVVTALRTAPAMAHQSIQLSQEAIAKAQSVMVQGNEEIYLSLSQVAQAFADAGLAIAQSAKPNGSYSRRLYDEGVGKLGMAIHMLN